MKFTFIIEDGKNRFESSYVGTSFRALRRALMFALDGIFVAQDNKVPTQVRYTANRVWEGKKLIKDKPDIVVRDL